MSDFYEPDNIPHNVQEAREIMADGLLKQNNELKQRIAELEEQLKLEQRPWSVEFCYNNGDNPFARIPLRIVDVGVADHILVVKNDKIEQALEKARMG